MLLTKLKALYNTPTTRIVLDLIGFLLAVLLVMRVGQSCYDKHEDQYKQSVSTWQHHATVIEHVNDTTTRVVDSLLHANAVSKKMVEDKTRQINNLLAVNSKLRVKHDSTFEVLSKQLPETCQVALTLATSYRSEADTLQRVVILQNAKDSMQVATINRLGLSVNLLQSVNDSLVTVIKKAPIHTNPKLLGFIPFPSRKAALVTGVVTGVVLTTAITHY